MIKSPKKRFQETPHATRLAAISGDPGILAGLDASLLQMVWEAGAANTPDAAAALHWQLTGAHKFRDLFLTISEMDKPLVKLPSLNLPHEV
jgi:hypothetical protein